MSAGVPLPSPNKPHALLDAQVKARGEFDANLRAAIATNMAALTDAVGRLEIAIAEQTRRQSPDFHFHLFALNGPNRVLDLWQDIYFPEGLYSFDSLVVWTDTAAAGAMTLSFKGLIGSELPFNVFLTAPASLAPISLLVPQNQSTFVRCDLSGAGTGTIYALLRMSRYG